MKPTTILVLAISMLCLAGDAAADQSITVEFSGPWSFVLVTGNTDGSYCGKSLTGATMTDCIVAISPSTYHYPAVFTGMKRTTTKLDTGIYILKLNGAKADSIGGGKEAIFVDGLNIRSKYYIPLIQRTSSGQDRYVVILPYWPNSPKMFEEAKKDESFAIAKITEIFVPPEGESDGITASYSTDVLVHYTVSDPSVLLMGYPDKSSNTSVSEMASVSFVLTPMNPDYECDNYARQAFKDMNHLLHAAPHEFVDFPDFTKRCRIFDPQRHDDSFPAASTFFNKDSKSIDISSVSGLIETLDKSNDALKSNYHDTIKQLLNDTRNYLKNDRLKDPKHTKSKVLLGRFNGIVTIANKNTGSGKKDQNKFAWEVATLRDIMQTVVNGSMQDLVTGSMQDVIPSSGVNCKAPMLSLAVSQ